MVGKVLFTAGVVMLALANVGGAFPLEKREEAHAPTQNQEINHAKDSKNVIPAKLPCGHDYHLAHIVKDEVIIYVPQDVVKETFEKVNKTLEDIQKNYEKKKEENEENSPFDEESIQHIVKIVPVGKSMQQEENNSKNQSKRDLKFDWSGPDQLRNRREVENISKNLTQEKGDISIPVLPEKLPCGHDYHLTHYITDEMFVYVPSNSLKETVKKINESLQEIKADYEKRKNETIQSSPFDREVVQHTVQVIPIYGKPIENVERRDEGQQSTRVQRLVEQVQATPAVEEPTPVVSSKDETESHVLNNDTLNTTNRLPCGHEYHIIHVVHDQMLVYVPPGILNETVVKVNKTLHEIQSKSVEEIESKKDSGFDKEVVHHMVKIVPVVPPHHHTSTGEIIWDSQQKSEPEPLPTPVPDQQQRHKRENNFHSNVFGVGYPQNPYHGLGHNHYQDYRYQDIPDPSYQRSYMDSSYNDGWNRNLGGYNQRDYGFKPHFPI
ncbi:uncharacterized protein LOC136032939 [Artemia franciscana]|uniref:DFP2 n=1 Tax=Artemia franciscana TaxID=6661 RepID=A0AA88I816_ARTSF|nr:hypothetical protein QYM36_000954 [Artemia franciscana]